MPQADATSALELSSDLTELIKVAGFAGVCILVLLWRLPNIIKEVFAGLNRKREISNANDLNNKRLDAAIANRRNEDLFKPETDEVEGGS
ncbi:hypothetical protein SAMN04515647_4405 [Cohaesibacter sp. ES.047]|uniref:hypothetical protein n=1 Tax=Cohaesibacter sp. ES.047 TaxID=1798205 RepID=UPI000BB80444|nr:hypothetical protein [Cohaesibacter sp. ES.047]SNY94082.1 hypothetical protein SAMN04515647_4405 [Cohaesibacter sp. ES.047]